ncbi:MAG: type I DNA topoisomerase [Pseudomonadota bacterium]
MTKKASRALLVVESPAKAKTIKKYLGNNFTVMASVGHVMDLPTDKLGVDIEKNFKPSYVVMKGKKTVLDGLVKEAEKVDEIFLAPDPDREGEAIAKHVAGYILSKLKKDKKPIHRILVHEITSKGVKEALEHPHDIDENMFNSQQARRILDRLVGYQISPILWKKVRRGLSAGRVQSVAVRLVVEREAAINSFKPVEYWVIDVDFMVGKNRINAKLFKINDEKAEVAKGTDAENIVNAVRSGTVSIQDIEKKEKKRNPLPPFITSKLQQDASRKLKFAPKKTMSVAQTLYEGVEVGDEGPTGLITYMRTDSVRVGADFQKEALQYIRNTYGAEYAPESPNFYKTKSNAQDAHEAIRPTDMEHSPEKIKKHLTADQFKLYSLIWNRFVASQMTPSVYDQTAIDLSVKNSGKNYVFRASGSVLKFSGYEQVYIDFRDDEEDEEKKNLPECSKSDAVSIGEIKSEQKFTQPPARFNDATIIKELEENGIGRPSTYASIISTIQERGYVEKAENQLKPSELGCIVTELLVSSFPEILNVEFTAGMEHSLDDIEEGKLNWVEVLKSFYDGGFSKSLKDAEKNMRNIKREETTTDVECPECKTKMIIKWGRRGQFLACPNYPQCKTTRSFTKHDNGDIKMEKAEETKELCPECNGPMLVKQGRFGKFLACANYPKCKGTKSLSTGVKCPECGKGEIAARKSKKGRSFYSCSKYPHCKFAIWNKPVEKTCSVCGYKVMEEKKDEYVCANKACGHKEPK